MNKLNKLYEAMLQSWGCVFKDQHEIWLKFAGNEVPVKVDGKQVYLPTQENLNAVTIGKVFFHPACENIISKETEIFKVIRKLTAAKLYEIFIPVTEIIIPIANRKHGKSLPSKTLELLAPFKGLSNVVRDEIRSILKICSIQDEEKSIDTRIIYFNMIKGGKTENGEQISYTATPSFPFYTEVFRACAQNSHLKASDNISFANSTYSAGAMRAVVDLFEAILPGCSDPTRYKYELTTQEAARLVAYIHSYALVASDINGLIGKFRKDFDPVGIYGIDLEYINDIESIGEIRNLIPPLEYNNYNRSTVSEEVVNTNTVNPTIIGLFNSSGTGTVTTQNNQPEQNRPVGPGVKTPPTNPGENFIGVQQYSNGIVEHRWRNPTLGQDRVHCQSENGNFISDTYVPTPGLVNPYVGAQSWNNPFAANPYPIPPVGYNQQPPHGYVPMVTGQAYPQPGFNNGYAQAPQPGYHNPFASVQSNAPVQQNTSVGLLQTY